MSYFEYFAFLKVIINNHDVVTLTKAFKEQKFYIKHKFSKLYKNRELLIEKEKALNAKLDSLDENKDLAILEAEEFYNNAIETVHNIKKEFIATINKNYNNYKKELAQQHSQIIQMAENLQNMKQISSNLSTEKDAIDFIKNK